MLFELLNCVLHGVRGLIGSDHAVMKEPDQTDHVFEPSFRYFDHSSKPEGFLASSQMSVALSCTQEAILNSFLILKAVFGGCKLHAGGETGLRQLYHQLRAHSQ